ncbi:hypothetical protein ANN_24025 [Periplaneta americana]|uniref:Reverse transcriptase n=1 Tax=Periplaneta americana TaxID=6978 RepID=A0ABQ8S282_PERAM|nr:hypothetical protein ANN_24025 [Periplaneta americana]
MSPGFNTDNYQRSPQARSKGENPAPNPETNAKECIQHSGTESSLRENTLQFITVITTSVSVIIRDKVQMTSLLGRQFPSARYSRPEDAEPLSPVVCHNLNDFVFQFLTTKCLSSSEYINAIKMSCNVTALRSVPGRTFSTTRCRHPGCSDTETLGHVLGFCKKEELLRNNRHHRALTAIANLLRNRGWEVHEEIYCVSEDDSHRRVDIIAINRRTQKVMVLDSTICFERDTNQALQINDDKRAKYVPRLAYLNEK